MNVNKLILGDNLDIMKGMDAESVDLIYLDPPFFSNRNYEIIWGDAGEIRSFQDRWSGGIEQYVAWLKERVEHMHRLLKDTGSIFLHCDWHADAYIRVHILDRIFGESNFRNHIIWKRNSAHNSADRCGIIHDSIFYYQKSNSHKWNQFYQNYNEQYIEEFFDSVDENGKRYKRADLTGAGTTNGISGEPWRNIDIKSKGRHWAYVHDELERLDKEGKIHWPKKAGGMPRLKVYPEDMRGIPLQDIWDDIKVLHNLSNERIGYPTQKPEALMERIIAMASNEGDTVLDPFVGGGTTVAVADRLKRGWIGIDQSTMAVKVSDFRLKRQTQQLDLFNTSSYVVALHKHDYDELRDMDAFKFESWIIEKFGGVPQNKKGGDDGVDGKKPDGTPIQVKQSDGVSVNVVKNFYLSAKQYNKALFEKNVAEKKPVGYIIAFSFGKGAIEQAAKLKNAENVIIELVAVEDIVPVARRSVIKLEINELERDAKGVSKIEFTADARSKVGIEFYSWDFDFNAEKGFNPQVIIDKDGRQTQTLKVGEHNIAVKAVDNDGIESMEIISLKVNGVVERL